MTVLKGLSMKVFLPVTFAALAGIGLVPTAAAAQAGALPQAAPSAAPAAPVIEPLPLLPPAPATSGFGLGYLTGTDLYGRCTEESPNSASYCFAYIAAVHDTMRAYENWLQMREFCVPLRTSQSDLRSAFLTEARRRPAELSGQAASVVVNALKRAFPCGGTLAPPSSSAAPGASTPPKNGLK